MAEVQQKTDDDDNATDDSKAKSALKNIETSCLYLIAIPDLTKKTYGQLFKLLARDNCIPLGMCT
jgi:hypothetical protein